LKKERIVQLEERVELLEKQLASTHQAMGKMFSFFGDNETKLETMRAILISSDICSVDDFEIMWDKIKGLVVKGEDVPINRGDFVRVSWKAYNVTEIGAVTGLVSSCDNESLLIGKGHLNMDSHLLGKTVKDSPIIFTESFPEGFPIEVMAGKKLNFTVTINKVKMKCKQEQTQH